MSGPKKTVVAVAVFGLVVATVVAWSPASAATAGGVCDLLGCDAGPDRCATLSLPGGGKLECFDTPRF